MLNSLSLLQKMIGFVGVVAVALRILIPPMHVLGISRPTADMMRFSKLDVSVLLLHVCVIIVLVGFGMFLTKEKPSDTE